MESHVPQAGQRFGLGNQRNPPEGDDGSLDIRLECLLCWRGDHGLEGVWEGVLLAEIPDLGKPGVLDAVVEDMKAVLVEDVGWAKEGHHVEECVLVLMYQCRGRERARQEV